MLHGAITQFLRDTAWGDLDYLIIDMPPGTGDIALTLSQLLPLTGAVVVCTPQEVALLDAVKAIAMFRKVNIPILGMVENMSGFICPDCGKRYDIFGSGGARRKAEELNVPFLGEVPINMQIRVQRRRRQDDGEFRRPDRRAVPGEDRHDASSATWPNRPPPAADAAAAGAEVAATIGAAASTADSPGRKKLEPPMLTGGSFSLFRCRSESVAVTASCVMRLLADARPGGSKIPWRRATPVLLLLGFFFAAFLAAFLAAFFLATVRPPLKQVGRQHSSAAPFASTGRPPRAIKADRLARGTSRASASRATFRLSLCDLHAIDFQLLGSRRVTC